MREFREGDVVSVEATVRFRSTGSRITLDLPGYYSPVTVDGSDVKMVRPNFEIGERVIYTPNGNRSIAKVLGVAGDDVWIEVVQGEYERRVVPIASVEREPLPEPTPVPEAPVFASAEAAG